MSPQKRVTAFVPLARAFAAFVALASAALILFAGRPALAAGGAFTIKTTSVDEKAGECHVKVRIDLSRVTRR